MSVVSPTLLLALELIGDLGDHGVIFMDQELTVRSVHGRAADFVVIGRPISDSVLAIHGLEEHLKALAVEPGRRLDLPAVATATGDLAQTKLNFTFVWHGAEQSLLGVVHQSPAQSALELELSKQIRARLMAEAETAARSRELTLANADLENFASVVSHDLRAPLRHMRFLIDTAKTNAHDGRASAAMDTLAALVPHIDRMSRMLRELFDYSTLGRKFEGLETVDSGALIDAIVQSWDDTPHVVTRLGSWPILETLKAPLDLVLRNLISNAIQHHDKGAARVDLRINEHGQHFAIEVIDDGPGIDPRHHETIFLPFRSLAGDAADQSTGMGLAMVKRAIGIVGGLVSVTSDPAHKRGTTFKIVWPKTISSY